MKNSVTGHIPDSGNLAQLGKNIERFIQQDPSNRGLANWAITGTLFPAVISLAGGKHILIATGFYILSAATIETDGPPGVIILANALSGMGKTVTILCDDHSGRILKAASDAVKYSADIQGFQPGIAPLTQGRSYHPKQRIL